ncbi:hypothetical protein N9M73_06545 [Rhodobacteraceae bacterium]|nr:hypothetical protein [Paracoccaceae bacterium]
MRLKSVDEFLEDFGLTAKPRMNVSIYQADYQCGCGKIHWFNGDEYIICEGYYKVMVYCPEGAAFVNSLKIKTFMLFKFKGFETLASAKLQTEEDVATITTLASYVRMA